MTYLRLLRSPALLLLWVTCQIVTVAQVNVTTYHYDNARTGQNTRETVLTTANVNYSTFGQLFWVPLDGQVYAQPLVLSNVSIGGGTHNVVYVATENNSLYAIDANNGAVYWQQSLMNAGATPVPYTDLCEQTNNITPKIGITGTPVIDTSTSTIYVVTSTKESGVYYQRLHALDVVTHAEKFGGPVVISGSYQGAVFSAIHQLNRAGLLLENGHIVVAFGQHCNNEGYGWVMSYKKSTLALEAVYNTDPLSIHGSVWMGGAGVAADSNGNLFFATGDGDFDGVSYFGDSIIKLGPPSSGVFPFLDYFTPFNQATLDYCDYDVGSGGVVLLPNLPAGSAHQHLLVQTGKVGTIYLIDRDTNKMGKYCSGCTSDTNIVQEQSDVLKGLWGSPAFWNNNVYFGSSEEPAFNGCGNTIPDNIKAYSFNAGGDGVLSTSPTSQSPETFAWPSPSPSVSSNGTANGILWALDNSGGAAVLRAYDATNLATELYNSNNSRDQGGGAIKFSVPTVANGKVYVGGNATNGTNGGLSVYGLLSAGPGCTPTLACHNYQSVILSQLTVACNNYPNWMSTSTQACSPNYPNQLCGGWVNGPSGVLSSSSATAGVPHGNVQGPPNMCYYNYTIGTTNFQSQLVAH